MCFSFCLVLALVGWLFLNISFPNTNLSSSVKSLFLLIDREGLGPVYFPILSNKPHVNDSSHSTLPAQSLDKPPPGHLPVKMQIGDFCEG